MKKLNLFKAAFISASLVFLLVIAGCTTSDNPIPAVDTANVVVQLQAGGSNYLVDGMTVSIRKVGGSVELTGVTGAEGIATIPVIETGDYEVILVTGVDATNLPQGNNTGREFVKSNPIADPYPNLTYNFGDPYPTVSVTDLDGSDYMVNADNVPTIIKVTVLQVGSSVSGDDGRDAVAAGTAAFAGRVMLSNLSFNDDYCSIGIRSNDINQNRLILYADTTAVGGGAFYGGSGSTQTPIGSMTYVLAGPIYFEAPGTDSGDWALGYNLSATDLKIRGNFGGNDETVNFLQFNGGAGNVVLQTDSTQGGSGHSYSFNYRIFQFIDDYPTPK